VRLARFGCTGPVGVLGEQLVGGLGGEAVDPVIGDGPGGADLDGLDGALDDGEVEEEVGVADHPDVAGRGSALATASALHHRSGSEAPSAISQDGSRAPVRRLSHDQAASRSWHDPGLRGTTRETLTA
jgi:hypothetical protein